MLLMYLATFVPREKGLTPKLDGAMPVTKDDEPTDTHTTVPCSSKGTSQFKLRS